MSLFDNDTADHVINIEYYMSVCLLLILSNEFTNEYDARLAEHHILFGERV